MARIAATADLPEIMEIVKQTIAQMHSYNNTQWDATYPCESDFAADIANGELYAADRAGRLAGFICVNRVEPAEYREMPWSRDCSALVIHRMAVDTNCRRNGVGAELLEHAEYLARRLQVDYLKTDTNSLNSNAQRLFGKFGYRKVGEMVFLGKESPFYCYEKSLILSE